MTPSKTSETSPTSTLRSHLDSFDSHLRLLICIAAKIATLHALAGRYTQKLSLDDTTHSSERSETQSAEDELNEEQARVQHLAAVTTQNSIRWLQIVCTHFGVEMANLPDDPAPDTGLQAGLEKGREFDVAYELVLLSLGLAARDAKEQEVVTKKEKDDKEPALEYTALERSLTMKAVGILGLTEQNVEDAEKAIAQELYFEMKEKEKERRGKEGGGKGEWDEATKVYKEKGKGSGNTMKWAATGAGFVLGGVAIGLTGGASFNSSALDFFSLIFLWKQDSPLLLSHLFLLAHLASLHSEGPAVPSSSALYSVSAEVSLLSRCSPSPRVDPSASHQVDLLATALTGACKVSRTSLSTKSLRPTCRPSPPSPRPVRCRGHLHSSSLRFQSSLCSHTDTELTRSRRLGFPLGPRRLY